MFLDNRSGAVYHNAYNTNSPNLMHTRQPSNIVTQAMLNQMKRLDYKIEMRIMQPLDLNYGQTRNRHNILESSPLIIDENLRQSQLERKKCESFAAGKSSSSIDRGLCKYCKTYCY
jgi:hypothetical protein